MKKTAVRRYAVLGGIVCVVALLPLGAPCVAGAHNFSRTDARDWAQSKYDNRLYEQDNYNCMCTVFVSLTYRQGAGAPFRDWGYNHEHAWWVDPGTYGSTTTLMYRSFSWSSAWYFNNFYTGWAPDGTSWIRKTNHRCSSAPQEDDRWYGGHIVFYHNSEGGTTDGGNTWDYHHSAVIYAQHTQSSFGDREYGTCKVERTGVWDDPYRGRNFINLSDRKDLAFRKTQFVSVNTLTND